MLVSALFLACLDLQPFFLLAHVPRALAASVFIARQFCAVVPVWALCSHVAHTDSPSASGLACLFVSLNGERVGIKNVARGTRILA